MSNNDTEGNNGIRYRRHRDDERAAGRRTILDVAGRLLAEEGVAALTMRRLAVAVGSSTTVLYTLFGDKDGLAHELYLEGCARLRHALEAVPPAAPLDLLAALAWAYRENALANPTYYGVMFERAIPGFVPSAASVERTYTSFLVILRAMRDAMDTGVLTPGDAVAATDLFWAAGHGLLGLERAGYFTTAEEARKRYSLGIAVVLRGLGGQVPPER